MHSRIARLMLAGIPVVTGPVVPALAQSVFVTGGMGTSCSTTDGTLCAQQTGALAGTTGVQVTRRFAITFRASRLDDASSGETRYFGPPPVNAEIARTRTENARTTRYGAEFLFHPRPAEGRPFSYFLGGGVGVTRSRERTTCVFGTCAHAFDMRLGERRESRQYVGFVAGLDLEVFRGIIARGGVRLDDFPSEYTVAQFTVEIGYRFGKRSGTRVSDARRGG